MLINEEPSSDKYADGKNDTDNSNKSFSGSAMFHRLIIARLWRFLVLLVFLALKKRVS